MNTFDFNKIEDFDNHINLSIPNYNQLLSLFIDLATIFSGENTTVIDYGCSTGKLLRALPKKEMCRYIGVDNSNLIPDTDSDGIEYVIFNTALEKNDFLTFSY